MKEERTRNPRRIASVAAAFAGAAALVIAGGSWRSGSSASGSRMTDGDDAGRDLYAKNCSSCHGESGRGDGPSGLFMKQKPADLRSDAVRKMSDEDLFSRITDGKQPMPGFSKKLSEEERRAIVRYVRQLGADNR